MRTVQKEKVYDYAFKAVLSLILLFCLYNVVCILFLSRYSSGNLLSRVSSAVSAVESNIKYASPKKTENIFYKSSLINKTDDSSWAHQIKQTTIFTGPIKTSMEKAEEIAQNEEVEVAENKEIIFKGMVDGLAYITIRKEINGQWHEQGFPTKIGEKIGKKKIISGKMLDFTTNYVLQDIIYNVQRPVRLNKKVVDLNESGEFDGTRIVPGETYMKLTSKIKYKDENGNINELWLQEPDKMIRVEEEKMSENAEDKTKSVISKKSSAIENLTKQQQEAIDKAKKPFENNVELLRSIIEESESGY